MQVARQCSVVPIDTIAPEGIGANGNRLRECLEMHDAGGRRILQQQRDGEFVRILSPWSDSILTHVGGDPLESSV